MKPKAPIGGPPGRPRIDYFASHSKGGLEAVAESPYRLFFPVGVLAGILGVLVFPMFFAGWLTIYPNQLHPRLMIHGFAGAFVMGFLGTSWPRFLEAKRLTVWECALLLVLWLAAVITPWWLSLVRVSDFLFAGAQGALILVLLSRLRGKPSWPPPGFVVSLGACVLAGIALVAPPSSLGLLYLRYGYWLIPILGVGSYLAPRFFPETKPGRSPRSRRIMLFSVIPAILISLVVESLGAVQPAYLIRAAALIWWCVSVLPPLWIRSESTRGFVLKIALWTIPAGYLVKACSPGPVAAYAHIGFIGGLGLILLLMADRVTLGHARNAPPTTGRSTLWRILFWLVVTTAATRVTADLIPKVMVSHYVYAALLWAIILVVWMSFHFRHWRS